MFYKNKKRVALIGTINCNSGIANAVNAIANIRRFEDTYEKLIVNTSNSNDNNSLINSIVFIKSIIYYLKALLERKIDLAHIHTSYGRSFYRKIFFICLSSLFKVKIILHFHASKFDEFFIDSSGLKKRIIEFFLKKTDAIVLLCNNWKEKIDRKFDLKNTFVINNSVPFDIQQVRSNKNYKDSNLKSVKILFLGVLIKTKGIYDIIEIAHNLTSISCKIIICGKGKEEKNLLKKVKEKNLNNIEYLGWASGKNKFSILNNCDIFLLPSYNEGMPMAILEAMAFGLPVISTKIAGIPDMVIDGENGYLLNPGDINGFVEKIKILILNQNKRRNFGEKSKIIAKKFKREKIAEEWHILYQKILYGNLLKAEESHLEI